MDNDGGHESLNAKRRIHLREISGEGDTPQDSVGQELRNARLRRGDEIATVSRALKIRKDHLEALEEDRLEDLPGRTYALGFVRSYARYLGLNAGEMADRFKHDLGVRGEESIERVAPIHQDDRRLPQGWIVIAGVLVLLLGYGAWHLLSSGRDDAATVPPAPSLSQPKPAPVMPKPVLVPMQQGAAVPATEDADAAPAAIPAPAAGPQTPATRIEPVARTQPVADTAPASTAPGPAVPAGKVYGEQNVSPRVVLRARGETRVTVRGPDGMLYINRDLAAGDTYRVPNLTGLTLAVADAGAIEVDLDGQVLGRAGQPRQVLGKVSLDPQSLTDRFNR